jgi:hypothetical protein
MNDAEFRAGEAKRLLEEITPFLDALEREAFEDATRVRWWHPMGLRTVKRLLERVSVIRDLKSAIEVTILVGKKRVN